MNTKDKNTKDLLIPYRKGDKWGLCDRNKNIIIPIKYDDVYIDRYNKDLIKVKLGDKWGIIDKTAKEIVSIK